MSAAITAAAGKPGLSTHMRCMRFLGIGALVTALFALLGGALWWAYDVWTSLEAADMPAGIYVAMTFGILFSLLIGVGLMALVFYSNRAGYDERAARGDFTD
jgi:hypothetical protein